MFASFRRAAARFRGRWHADLEFQHSSLQRVQGEQLNQLLVRLNAQEGRFGQLDCQLIGLKRLSGAMSQELAARWGALEGAEPRTQAALAGLDQRLRDLDAGLELRLGELDARLLARLAATQDQATGLAESLLQHGQTVQQSLEILNALRQEFQNERQRQLAWETHWEETLQQDRAEAEARERQRDEERNSLAQREQARREEQLAQAQSNNDEKRNKLTPEDLAAIERQGVFIVGSPRSGTTILSDCLNLSREVYILQEAAFFCSDLAAEYAGWENYDFASTFNARHVLYGNPRAKGTYVPTAETPDRTPLEFLNRFRGKYRYLGEKVPFGPQPHYMGDQWESDFITYQARHFYHSQYFIIVRAPHEALWSMHKLFPDRPITSVFECWLRCLRTSLELYLAFPQTHLILLEWLDATTVLTISDVLQTEIPLPSGWLGRMHQASALNEGELAPVLQSYRVWCHECGEIYTTLRGEFSRESLQFASNAHPREFLRLLRQRISALLEDVMRHAEPKAKAA